MNHVLLSFIFFICFFIVLNQGSILESLTKLHQMAPIDDSELSTNNVTGNQHHQVRRRFAPEICKSHSRNFNPKFDVRISERKCYEYLWDVSYQAFKDIKEDNCRKYGPGFRIADGSRVKKGDFPHMAALGWRNGRKEPTFRCGGSLISKNFVLTAAFCVWEGKPDVVRLGTTTWPKNGVDYEVKATMVHPEYEKSKFYNDIALVQLKKFVKFTVNLLPACLWSYDYFGVTYSQLQMTGWGGKSNTSALIEIETHKSMNTELLLGDMDVIVNCIEYEGRRVDNSRQLCVRSGNFKLDARKPFSNCLYDSGGPLQLKIPLTNSTQGFMHFIVGVIGGYKKCGGRENRPHTRVSSYIDWIEDIVWPKKLLPEAKGESELFILPDVFDSGQIVYLEVESFTRDNFSVSLIADNDGVDYNNIVFKAFVDLQNRKLELETLKDGYFQGPENPGYYPAHVFIDNMLDISFRITTDPDKKKDFLDIRMGRGIINIPVVLVHDISSMRYIEVKGEKTHVKTFRSSYTKIP